jgi:hypothetical protein
MGIVLLITKCMVRQAQGTGRIKSINAINLRMSFIVVFLSWTKNIGLV